VSEQPNCNACQHCNTRGEYVTCWMVDPVEQGDDVRHSSFAEVCSDFEPTTHPTKAVSEEACPFCTVSLVLISNGDLHCDKCGRDWFPVECEGETCLQSRRRTVHMTKLPEAGDNINDCIKPAAKTKGTK